MSFSKVTPEVLITAMNNNLFAHASNPNGEGTTDKSKNTARKGLQIMGGLFQATIKNNKDSGVTCKSYFCIDKSDRLPVSATGGTREEAMKNAALRSVQEMAAHHIEVHEARTWEEGSDSTMWRQECQEQVDKISQMKTAEFYELVTKRKSADDDLKSFVGVSKYEEKDNIYRASLSKSQKWACGNDNCRFKYSFECIAETQDNLMKQTIVSLMDGITEHWACASCSPKHVTREEFLLAIMKHDPSKNASLHLDALPTPSDKIASLSDEEKLGLLTKVLLQGVELKTTLTFRRSVVGLSSNARTCALQNKMKSRDKVQPKPCAVRPPLSSDCEKLLRKDHEAVKDFATKVQTVKAWYKDAITESAKTWLDLLNAINEARNKHAEENHQRNDLDAVSRNRFDKMAEGMKLDLDSVMQERAENRYRKAIWDCRFKDCFVIEISAGSWKSKGDRCNHPVKFTVEAETEARALHSAFYELLAKVEDHWCKESACRLEDPKEVLKSLVENGHL